MTFRITVHTQTRSTKGLTMPEPINFGFDEMVKAKAKADAEFQREIERRVTIGGNVAHCYKKPSSISENTVNYNGLKYEYDLNIAAELMTLTDRKRRKNDK